jgi:transposase
MAVHQEALAVAYGAQDRGADVVLRGAIGTHQGAIAQRIRTMPAKATPRVVVDEAGPGGDGPSRDLTTQGRLWGVVAPSLSPTKAGDRVKADRRDAIPMAKRVNAATGALHG